MARSWITLILWFFVVLATIAGFVYSLYYCINSYLEYNTVISIEVTFCWCLQTTWDILETAVRNYGNVFGEILELLNLPAAASFVHAGWRRRLRRFKLSRSSILVFFRFQLDDDQ